MFSMLEQYKINSINIFNLNNDFLFNNFFFIFFFLNFLMICSFFYLELKFINLSKFFKIKNMFFYMMINWLNNELNLKKYIFNMDYIYMFSFILLSNMFSLYSNFFTMNTQFLFVLNISMYFWMMSFWFIFIELKSMKKFLYFFYHEVGNKYLTYLMFFMEILSYFMSSKSLALRITMNLMSGHILLELSSMLFFKFFLFKNMFLFLFLLMFFIAIFFLEFMMGIIQAYMFVLLSMIYLNEMLKLKESFCIFY